MLVAYVCDVGFIHSSIIIVLIETYLGSPGLVPGCCVAAWDCVPGADLKAMGQREHLKKTSQ